MKRFAFVFAAAFAVRAAYLAGVGPDPRYAMTADSVGYLQEARNLRYHRVFSDDLTMSFRPDTVRTPLYPAFLSAFMSEGEVRARDVERAQAVLGAAAAALIAQTAFVFWESGVAALAAGLFAALDPMLLMHAPLLLTETLFLFLFSDALLAFALGLKTASIADAAAAGLLFGLAALTRPVGLYYFAPAALVAAWALRSRQGRAAWLAVFVCASAALPLAWMTRNEAVSGVFTFCSIQGLNVEVRAASVQAQLTGESSNQAYEDVERMILTEHPAAFASVAEESQFKGKWAARFIARHPIGYVEVMAKDVVKLLGGHGMELFAWEILKDPYYDPMHAGPAIGGFSGTRGLMARRRSLRLAIPLYTLALGAGYALALMGMIAGWKDKEKRWAVVLCASVVIYFLGVTAGLGAYYRLRIPLLGAVYLLAGRGLQALLERRKPRESRAAA